MLSFKEYTYGIDLWSAACIFAEMLGRKHLFPSRTYVEHLNLVLKHLGLPSDSCISRIGSQKAQKYVAWAASPFSCLLSLSWKRSFSFLAFLRAHASHHISRRTSPRYLRSLNPIQSPPLQEVYPHASADAIDLLQKMLKFDPDERISIEDALGHPYLKEHHDLTDEPSCTEFDFDFEAESGELSAQDYREKILEEVQAYTASLERPSSTGSVFPVSPSPFGGGGFPVSPSPAFKFGGSGARVSPSAFPSSGTFTASPSARPFPGSPVTRSAATRESKRRRTDSASASSANGDSPKEWAAAMAARIGSRTPPPVAARKKKAAASPPPADWAAGGAAAAAVASVVPTRTVSSASSGSIASHAQLASGKLLSTPDGASCVDVQWLDHVDPNWLTDQQLQTELEMGAPNVFKNPP
jgi:serine/threonine protein kinase